MKMLSSSILLCMLLSGCAATIDRQTPPPADWPIKQVNVYVVAKPIVEEICACHGLLYACTLFYPRQGIAEIWLPLGYSQQHREHEKLHALGYDHVGGLTIQQMMEDYRSGTVRESRMCPERMDEYRKLPFTVEYQ